MASNESVQLGFLHKNLRKKTSTRENLLGERNERLVQLVWKYHGTANAIYLFYCYPIKWR